MKALIVEDLMPARVAGSLVLGMYGFEVDQAEDGRQGVEMGIANSYDLIVMDIGLPYIDGIEATRQILASGSTAKVIGLTANLRKYPRETLRDCGMAIAYEKPLTPFIIADILTRFRWLVPKQTTELMENLPAIDSYEDSLTRWDNPFGMIEETRQAGIDSVRQYPSALKTMFEDSDWEKLQFEVQKLQGAALHLGTVKLSLACCWLYNVLCESPINVDKISYHYKLMKDALDAYLVAYEDEYNN